MFLKGVKVSLIIIIYGAVGGSPDTNVFKSIIVLWKTNVEESPSEEQFRIKSIS